MYCKMKSTILIEATYVETTTFVQTTVKKSSNFIKITLAGDMMIHNFAKYLSKLDFIREIHL
jgi:hypothetical protein